MKQHIGKKEIALIFGIIVLIIAGFILVNTDTINRIQQTVQSQTSVETEKPNKEKYADIEKIVQGLVGENGSVETPLNNTQGRLVLNEFNLDDKMMVNYAISVDLRGESTHAIAILIPKEEYRDTCRNELIRYVSDKQEYISNLGNKEAYELAKEALVGVYGDYMYILLTETLGGSYELREQLIADLDTAIKAEQAINDETEKTEQ